MEGATYTEREIKILLVGHQWWIYCRSKTSNYWRGIILMLNRLPDLLYNFSSKPLDPDFLLVKNIWRRAQILVEYKSQVTLFMKITVGDGERPEDIATRLYRNPFYNWTIFVANDITDYYAQWPTFCKQLQDLY